MGRWPESILPKEQSGYSPVHINWQSQECAELQLVEEALTFALTITFFLEASKQEFVGGVLFQSDNRFDNCVHEVFWVGIFTILSQKDIAAATGYYTLGMQ